MIENLTFDFDAPEPEDVESSGQEPVSGSRLAPLSVADLNERVNDLLELEVGPVWVVGELSRFLAHRSGHWYFTLKDEGAAVSCAMFRGRNSRVKFKPEDGQQLLVLARPGVYVAGGRYQLIVETIEPRGAGADALALAQLKARLAKEGLFDAERKKPIPWLSKRIGVVTSIDGAALRDVLRVLKRRFAGVDVVVAGSAVQGPAAAPQIVAALAAIDTMQLDALLVVRGGGAREDLAAFDDERVVRAIANCDTPVICGVGHEIDTTLADLVADKRAPTPSAAAELVVRERIELQDRVQRLHRALDRSMRLRLQSLRGRLLRARASRGLRLAPARVQRQRIHLSELTRRLERHIEARLAGTRRQLAELIAQLSPEQQKQRLTQRRARTREAMLRAVSAMRARTVRARQSLATGAARLDTLSPLAVLSRGYAVVTRIDTGGALVDDSTTLKSGDRVHLRLKRGSAAARIERTFGAEEDNEDL